MREKINFYRLIKLFIIAVIIASVMLSTFYIIKFQIELFLNNLQNNLSKEINREVNIEGLQSSWNGINIIIKIDKIVIPKGNDGGVSIEISNINGELSAINSLLKLNISFNDLIIDKILGEVYGNNYKEINLLSSKKNTVFSNYNKINILDIIFANKNVLVKEIDLNIYTDNKNLKINNAKFEIKSGNKSSIFNFNGVIDDDAKQKIYLYGNYKNINDINVNAEIGLIELNDLFSFMMLDKYILEGSVKNFSLNAKVVKGFLHKLDINFYIDNLKMLSNYTIQSNNFSLFYDVDKGNGFFESNDMKITDSKIQDKPLLINSIQGDILIKDLVFSCDNMTFVSSDFSASARFELFNKDNFFNYLILANFDNLAVDYAKLWLSESYIPASVHNWLNKSINGGKVTSIYAHRDPKNNVLQVDFGGAALNFSDSWPQITNLNTTLSYHNGELSLDNSYANILDVPFVLHEAKFSDIDTKKLSRLTLKGKSDTNIDFAIKFLEETPLKSSVGSKIKIFEPSGDVSLELNLDILLNKNEPVILANGLINLFDSNIKIPKTSVDVKHIYGTFKFNNFGTTSDNLSFKINEYDTTANFSFNNKNSDNFSFNFKTRVEADALLEFFPIINKDKVSGSTMIEASLDLPSGTSVDQNVVNIKTDLIGIESNLIPPFAKLKNEKVPLLIGYKISSKNDDVVYTSIQGFDFQYLVKNKKLIFKNNNINGDVIYIDPNIIKLNIDNVNIDSFDSDIKKIDTEILNKNKFNVIASIKELQFKNKYYNNLKLELKPRSYGYQISKFYINSKYGNIHANGKWNLIGKESTSLSGVLSSNNYGNLLSYYLDRKDITDAYGEFNFSVDWDGNLKDFAINKIYGDLQLNLFDGGISKVDPGFAKVLGLFSLEGLGRRLKLNFSDLAEGLVFDRLNGDFRLNSGHIFTNNLNIAAAGFKVGIAGNVYLTSNKADLSMIVIPNTGITLPLVSSLTAGVPMVGAIFWMIDKAVGTKLSDIAVMQFYITGKLDNLSISEVKPSIE